MCYLQSVVGGGGGQHHKNVTLPTHKQTYANARNAYACTQHTNTLT